MVDGQRRSEHLEAVKWCGESWEEDDRAFRTCWHVRVRGFTADETRSIHPPKIWIAVLAYVVSAGQTKDKTEFTRVGSICEATDHANLLLSSIRHRYRVCDRVTPVIMLTDGQP